jgi:hypothetical protein
MTYTPLNDQFILQQCLLFPNFTSTSAVIKPQHSQHHTSTILLNRQYPSQPPIPSSQSIPYAHTPFPPNTLQTLPIPLNEPRAHTFRTSENHQAHAPHLFHHEPRLCAAGSCQEDNRDISKRGGWTKTFSLPRASRDTRCRN